MTEDAYHLTGEKFGEATNRAWNRLQAAWLNFQTAREKLAESDPGTSVTRERWLLPLFQLLDYGRLQTAKAEEVGGKQYAVSHAWQQTPIHLVGCNVELDRRIPSGTGGLRSSPHSLLQELLNRSDQHLWGIVSNGLRLRLLRDNISLTRQAYVEFDLEAMMAGEAYPDFVLLWLLLHQSRFEAERPDLCQLEKWSRAARTEGVRILEGLRDGVKKAIEQLGQGFLAHPSNAMLREELRSGALDKQDYYRQLLRLVYRLLFLFVAEDRDLLLAPTGDPAAQKRYREHYATTRLRRLATTRAGSRHHDLYRGLRLVMDRLSDDGCSELALPALGGFLFSPRALPNLNSSEISNLHVLAAIRSLAVTHAGQSRRVVDYKNLGAEELGSIYESLLELHPDLNAEAASFELKVAAGSERKKTGSYYTPTSLISCLLDSALDPVLLDAAKQSNAEAAILKLKVVDPACGSGHFLIAAAHRIAKRLAAVRTGEEEPPPEAQRKAIRDVIGHCIYGVDVNPMAVELCKVSLWMEALEPGKPLSFLEHRIQCGNSLLGATPALLAEGIPDEAFTPIEGDDKEICKSFKRINRDERNKQMRLFAATTEPWQQLGNFAASLMSLDTVGDDSIEAIRAKERMYEEAIRSGDYLDGRFWADTWCAAFVWKKTHEASYPVTEEAFRRIERNPHACEPWMRCEIERLAIENSFFHWHLAFPDVFKVAAVGEKPENSHSGWNGGFDVVLGNPPWEMVELSEKEFFAQLDPSIALSQTARARQLLITSLRETRPELYEAYSRAKRVIYGTRHFVQSSGRFPRSSQGRINLYPLFVEAAMGVLSSKGRAGLIVPSAVAMDAYNADLFAALAGEARLCSYVDFENSAGIFEQVHRSYRFCLLTFTGERGYTGNIKTGYAFTSVADMADPSRTIEMSADSLRRFSPKTLAPPIFRTHKDHLLAEAAYMRFGVFYAQNEHLCWSPAIQRMLSLSDPGDLFRAHADLESASEDSSAWERLYSGKAIHAFNHRFAHYHDGDWSRSSRTDLANSTFSIKTEYYARKSAVNQRLASKPGSWLLGYRDIARSTDERTLIAAALPRVGCDTTCRNVYVHSAAHGLLPCLLANFNSFVLDYFVRQKVIGTHLGAGTFEQVPVLPANTYSRQTAEFLSKRVLELTFTSEDIRGFAQEVGYAGPPFRWDEDRRFYLMSEIDAMFFRLYLISRPDVNYILDTFPIVRRKDQAAHGEYRTKRVILEVYDAMADAERTGVPYQTRLDPPPADPRVAHPASNL